MAARPRPRVLVADLRLDNAEELARHLDSDHTRDDDRALLLRAYDEWGPACVEHLLGDYAFAIWDPAERLLFCARDVFGVKPFYYSHQPRLFAFASEARALTALGEVSAAPDPFWIADFVAQVFEDKERTFYRDVRRLPPAHTLIVSRTAVRLRRYWAPDPQREIRFRSDDEYAEAYRGHLAEAVRVRLAGRPPVGSMLSGGLDSSSIVCLAREERGAESQPLPTFSLIFPGTPSANERPFIDAVLAGGGIEPHFIDGGSLPALPPALRTSFDTPPYAWDALLNLGLLRSAKASGIRSLLSGLMGDTTVSWGLLRMTELLRSGRLVELARSVRQHARSTRVPQQLAFRKYFWTAFKHEIIRPIVPAPVLRLRRRRVTPVPSALQPGLVQRLALEQRHADLQRPLRRRVRTVREAQALEALGWHIPALARDAGRARGRARNRDALPVPGSPARRVLSRASVRAELPLRLDPGDRPPRPGRRAPREGPPARRKGRARWLVHDRTRRRG